VSMQVFTGLSISSIIAKTCLAIANVLEAFLPCYQSVKIYV